MRKMQTVFVLVAIFATFLCGCIASAGDLPPVNRARIAMKIIKSKDVTTLVNYQDTKIDYLDGPTSLEWADAFWIHIPPKQMMPNGEPYPRDPSDPLVTNAVKSMHWINCMRTYCIAVRGSVDIPAAGNAARADAKAALVIKAATDLGEDEELESEE